MPASGYSFCGFVLDLKQGCLLRDGEEVKLRPKSFEALLFLIRNPGRLISKDEMIQALWPDSFVTDGSLVGSIQRSDGKIRITSRLVDVRTGQALWAGTFEDDSPELFEIQDSLSRQILASLAPSLRADGSPARPGRETISAAAYQLNRKGRFFWNKRTEDGYYRAIEHFEKAKREDRSYALAYAGLADTWHLLGDYSYLPPGDTFPKAKAAAESAIRLDEGLAEAHNSLAYAAFLYDWDWALAAREFRRALDLNPSYATAHQWYGEYLAASGRFEDARAELNRALELDPASLILNAEQGWISYVAGDYDRAMEECLRAVEMDGNFYPAHFWFGQSCEMKGLYREAVAAYEKAVSLSAGSPEVVASLGHAYARSGRREAAESMLRELESLARRRYVSPYFFALIHEGLGDRRRAIGWLQKACADRSRSIPFLRVDPMFARLRGDSEFAGLLRRVGMPPS